MNSGLIIIGLVVILAVALLAFVKYKLSHRGLSAGKAARIQGMIDRVSQMPSPALQIMEYDKVLDHLLSELGFFGSVGEKLKKAGPRFSNIDAIWNVHKLRNTIAHQHGATGSQQDADYFRRVLTAALQRVS